MKKIFNLKGTVFAEMAAAMEGVACHGSLYCPQKQFIVR